MIIYTETATAMIPLGTKALRFDLPEDIIEIRQRFQIETDKLESSVKQLTQPEKYPVKFEIHKVGTHNH